MILRQSMTLMDICSVTKLYAKYLDIDGIRIYSKHSDSVIYESGEYSNPLSSFDYNDVNEYLLLFDDNRMLASNNIHSFEFKCKAQYKFFAANNINALFDEEGLE